MHLFKNAFAEKPDASLTVEELVEKLQEGYWKKDILNLRSKAGELNYKKLKNSLPAVTISALLKNRDREVPVEKRLIKHTGLICLDIDKKDNPKMRVKDIIDPECLLEYVSCSGEGKKLIYRCKPTNDSNEHRRIYDAAVLRLRELGFNIKVDPIVKSIASLQYVSFDPYLHYNPKSRVHLKPLPKPKIKPQTAASKDAGEITAQLTAYIKALGKTDPTAEYEDWLAVAFGLAHTLGEQGRTYFHQLSKNYKGYAKAEADEKYDSVLDRNIESLEKPRTIASVFNVINEALPKVARKQLAKKYAHSHAVTKEIATKGKKGKAQVEAEDLDINNSTDLEGMVRYKLFLFKKVIDKETKTVVDLLPNSLNLTAFELLLRQHGFYRYEKLFVFIKNNVVERCDGDDILRYVTEYVEADGDYHFSYKETEFIISWEELAHLWRKLRGNSTIYNQLRSSLTRWEPNLLSDTDTTSYIPYQNGVAVVTANNIKIENYENLKQQIWKERILPRSFEQNRRLADRRRDSPKNKTTVGSFAEFFANVCGRGDTYKQKISSKEYRRSLWYYGYMLQGHKRQSVARAWLLYDIRSGNNGRSGKTIIGQAVGKIRNVATIDGKTLDVTQRFAFQIVEPWTDVVFIDDPKKHLSLVPLFNMISGEFQTDKKNEKPLVKNVKFMIASNWILEAEGTSEQGRQFVTQLDDFYVRYAKEHNTIEPLIKLHKAEFFTGWDEKEWGAFDRFSLQALQFHLKETVPANEVVGNAMNLRFVQMYEEEMFFELATLFSAHAKANREGNALLIVMNILTSAIVEHSKHTKSLQAAGYVARLFLKSVTGGSGGAEVTITNTEVAGLTKQAYKVNTGAGLWKVVDFGAYNDRISRGNNKH